MTSDARGGLDASAAPWTPDAQRPPDENEATDANVTREAGFAGDVRLPGEGNWLVDANGADLRRPLDVSSGNDARDALPDTLPANPLVANPSRVEFGDVPLGETSPMMPVIRLTNTGDAPVSGLMFKIIQSFFDNDFTIVSNSCLGVIPGKQFCEIGLRFRPEFARSRWGTMVIAHPLGQTTVAMFGRGLGPPELSIQPDNWHIDAKVGTSTPSYFLEVKNVGDLPTGMPTVSITGDTSEFTMSHGCKAPLAPQGSCLASVEFHPTSEGTKKVRFVVTAPPVTASVPITGFATVGPLP